MSQIFPTLLRYYNVTFAARPLLTMTATNTLLFAIADTTAQTVPSLSLRYRCRCRRSSPPSSSSSSSSSPPRFDWNRLIRFASWGCIVAPFQFKWLRFLARRYPFSRERGDVGALLLVKRVGLDQVVFAPVGLAGFFAWMTVSGGGGWRDVRRKFGEVYFGALRSNYILWPAVQMVNFRLIPLRFQLPFASSWGILWGAYLSLANSAAEA
ncbi:putative integral membrane protein, Mpv17/PMP22 family [Tuber brumale]|nr:putative integral membrane protein, Mpv17/PMP22 family [Tuber brumale]